MLDLKYASPCLLIKVFYHLVEGTVTNEISYIQMRCNIPIYWAVLLLTKLVYKCSRASKRLCRTSNTIPNLTSTTNMKPWVLLTIITLSIVVTGRSLKLFLINIFIVRARVLCGVYKSAEKNTIAVLCKL